MNLGERLFELRKKKNLSQEDVAGELNVTRQTVSKWETNQSTPDFDKIVPLCELFEIGTEELLTGKKPEIDISKNKEDKEKVLTKQEVRKKSAEVVSRSVFIYILSIAVLITLEGVFKFNDIISVSIFLIMIAYATAKIIKHFMSVPKYEKDEREKKEDNILKQINNIIGVICLVIYFIISFSTMAWYITWIIFIINGLICQIVKLIFMLKESEKDEE